MSMTKNLDRLQDKCRATSYFSYTKTVPKEYLKPFSSWDFPGGPVAKTPLS